MLKTKLLKRKEKNHDKKVMVKHMAFAYAFSQVDYQSSIMANNGTQVRSTQLEEEVRALRESMDKIPADPVE